MIILSNKALCLSADDNLAEVLPSLLEKKLPISGFAIVVDIQGRLIGVLNLHDIFRFYVTSKSLDSSVSVAMNTDPIYSFISQKPRQILENVLKMMKVKNISNERPLRYIPLLNNDMVVVDVVDTFYLSTQLLYNTPFVEVFGLGFVGLTLAGVLASRGFRVHGTDTNDLLISDLLVGKLNIHEPLLNDMVSSGIKDLLTFSTTSAGSNSSVKIIAVGTPISNDGSVDLSALKNATETISKNLTSGDLVMLRSTVPVSTTRNFVIPILEQNSGLIAGSHFHVAFTPERTVEGKAVSELISLPQIVGGFTPLCAFKALTFWQSITSSTVKVSSLESAELVKLVNNSFRDLSFSFSNSLSLLCDKYNINSHDLVAAANEGYPRDRIPFPGPGVGGYCLTKDPLLYASQYGDLPHSKLASISRNANISASIYPVQLFHQYCKAFNLSIKNLRILIVGIAFKGLPETNDVRGSISLSVAKQLSDSGASIYIQDHVISDDVLSNLGFEIYSNNLASLIDAVFILNNHPCNIADGFLESFREKKTFLFDAWNLLDSVEVNNNPNFSYATMGYASFRD